MTQQTAPKLCVDCRNFQRASMHDPAKEAEFSRCLAVVRETNESLTLVDGRALVITYKFCDLARRVDHECGPDAKLFKSLSPVEAA